MQKCGCDAVAILYGDVLDEYPQYSRQSGYFGYVQCLFHLSDLMLGVMLREPLACVGLLLPSLVDTHGAEIGGCIRQKSLHLQWNDILMDTFDCG